MQGSIYNVFIFGLCCSRHNRRSDTFLHTYFFSQVNPLNWMHKSFFLPHILDSSNSSVRGVWFEINVSVDFRFCRFWTFAQVELLPASPILFTICIKVYYFWEFVWTRSRGLTVHLTKIYVLHNFLWNDWFWKRSSLKYCITSIKRSGALHFTKGALFRA